MLCAQVSWGVQRLTLGMLAWALSFLLVGVLFVPLLIYLRENKVQATQRC